MLCISAVAILLGWRKVTLINHYRISSELERRGARFQSGFEDPIGPDHWWTGHRFEVTRPTGWYRRNLGEQIGHWLESSPFLCVTGDSTWSLEGPTFTKEDLQMLPSLLHLRTLSLSNLSLKPEDLVVLSKLKELRILSIEDDSLNDDAVPYFCQLNKLIGLFIHAPNISKEGLGKLRIGLINCRIEHSGH